MSEQYEITYQNIGKTTYLALCFKNSADIVESMAGTITSNTISHFLKAYRLNMNGEAVMRYQISSMQSFDTMLKTKGKLKVGEVAAFIDSAVQALREAEDYRLPAGGLAMNPELIFVDPNNFDTQFVYIPVRTGNADGLKELLINLIMQGRIERSDGNFVQVLLDTVNSTPFSLEQLEACVETYKPKTRGVIHKNTVAVSATGASVNNGSSAAGSFNAMNEFNPQGKPGQQNKSSVNGINMNRETSLSGCGNSAAINAASGMAGAKVSAGVQDSVAGNAIQYDAEQNRIKYESNGFSPKAHLTDRVVENNNNEQRQLNDKENKLDDTAKKKFILPQAFVMVFIAACVSFKVFVNESGGIAVDKIVAVAVAVILVEIVLYRNAFANKDGENKDRSAVKKTEKGIKQNSKTKQLLSKGNEAEEPKKTGAKPQVPRRGTTNSIAENAWQGLPQPQQTIQQSNKIVQPSQSAMQQSQPAIQNPYVNNVSGVAVNTYGGASDNEDKTELVDSYPYLEYYEGGKQLTYPLLSESTLVGHLSGQVQLLLHNSKVGRIHAEFIVQNGRVFVKDLNSLNGTYINGNSQRLNSNMPYELNDGDRVRLANMELILRCPM